MKWTENRYELRQLGREKTDGEEALRKIQMIIDLLLNAHNRNEINNTRTTTY